MKHILTGGPSTGKTTLINALAQSGYAVTQEAATQVINAELARSQIDSAYEPVLPWTQFQRFEHRVYHKQQEAEAQLPKSGVCFVDRGLPDILAYCSLFDSSATPARLLERAARAEYGTVYFIDQLPSFETTTVRREDSELSKRIHEMLYKTYDQLGFAIEVVPVYECTGATPEDCVRKSVQRRLEHILQTAIGAVHREIEGKFPVDDFTEIKLRLANYAVHEPELETQQDHYLRIPMSATVRVRNNTLLTIKGQNTGSMASNRYERNIAIPSIIGSLACALPARCVVQKERESYRPVYDSGCVISLDTVRGLGRFVEIEARSEGHVAQWKDRLGIRSEPVLQSYQKLLSR
jgi:predicted ATPase/adenylate cyclase class IV